MPRRAVPSIAFAIAFAMAAALAAAVGGCADVGSGFSQIGDDIKEGNFFNKPIVEKPNWAKLNRRMKTADLGPRGPVGPEDLVNADGSCAPATAPAPEPTAQTPQPSAQADAAETTAEPEKPAGDAAFGSLAGDLAGAPMPQGPPPKLVPPKPKRRVASNDPAAGLGGLQPEGQGLFSAPTGGVIGGVALGMTECEAVRRAGRPSRVQIGAGDKGARKTVLTYLSGPWPGIYTFASGRLKVVDAVPAPTKPAPKKQRGRTPARTATNVTVQ